MQTLVECSHRLLTQGYQYELYGTRLNKELMYVKTAKIS